MPHQQEGLQPGGELNLSAQKGSERMGGRRQRRYVNKGRYGQPREAEGNGTFTCIAPLWRNWTRNGARLKSRAKAPQPRERVKSCLNLPRDEGG